MLNRRRFAGLLGATAMGGLAAPALIRPSFAQGAAPLLPRGNYLIKNGAVITVDAAGVLPRADVHVNNGRIEAVGPDLNVAGAETIDATDMIVMPGFIDTHYHMWSALGRNFVGDGFGYFPAKNATSKLYTAEDFYASVMLGLVELANAGITTRAQLVAQHAHARARRRRAARPSRVDAARPLRLRPHRPDAAQRAGQLRRRRSRQAASISPPARRSRGCVHLGLNLRGHSQSDPADLPDRHGRRARTQAADRAARGADAAELGRHRGVRDAAAGSARTCCSAISFRRATSTPS